MSLAEELAPVPGDHGGRFDGHQGPGPVGAQRLQGDPEQAVGREKARTAAAVRHGCQLVAQGEIVEDEGLWRAGQGAHGPDEKLEEQQHRGKMRGDLCDCKAMGASDSRFKARGRNIGEAQPDDSQTDLFPRPRG